MADFTLDHPRGSASGNFDNLLPIRGFGEVTRDGVTHSWDFCADHIAWTLDIGPEHPMFNGHVDQAQVFWQADGKCAEWPDDDSIPDDAVIDILTDAFTRYLDGDLHMVGVPNG